MGWNGWVSNAGVNRARYRIEEFSKDPGKKLIAVDPLRSETARRADIHLQIRMGTAALFLRSLIAVILQEGWENRAYLDRYCRGLDQVEKWFQDFDVSAALRVCGVDNGEAREVARIYAAEPTAIRSDLGLLMDRQSTMNSYLEMLLMAVCGRIGIPGGNMFAGHVMPLGPHSDERDPGTWRTVATDIPAIMGYHPPNVVPEEILSGNDDRLRAMIVSGANPMLSYADAGAYDKALRNLDLLVTIEIAMTETARLSHYVLPARSAFEKWDATFFSITFPDVYFQLRHPCYEPRGEVLEEGEIHTRMADALGLVPEIPQALREAAQGDRKDFAPQLMGYLARDKKTASSAPFVVAETLGRTLGSAHLAAAWALMLGYPRHEADALSRAGYEVGPDTGEALFGQLLEHPEGIRIGRLDPDTNLEKLRTPDKKIHLHAEEMEEWMPEIEPRAETEALNHPEYPFVLIAGRHFPYVANSIMRDPAWNRGKEVCTLLVHPEDAGALGIADQEEVRVRTRADWVRIPVEISDIPARGTVVIPHGFGGGASGKDLRCQCEPPHQQRPQGSTDGNPTPSLCPVPDRRSRIKARSPSIPPPLQLLQCINTPSLRVTVVYEHPCAGTGGKNRVNVVPPER
jgi:anaerobic selenocysteine-containing dehydrogenase